MSSPLLVVTVAAPTMAELRLRRDSVAGADLIELRIDQAADPAVDAALAGRHTPVVLTCRAQFEGGGFRGSERERFEILRSAIAQGADYVDVEFKAEFAPELIRSTGGKGIVVSSHDFDGVPSDLADRVRAMRATGAEIVKIAVYPRTLSDNLRLLSLGDARSKTVLIGMGPAGLPTRVLAAHFGSCWSYAGDGYAPGQIVAERMLAEFRFRDVTPRTAIYGITGAPLSHSVSPAMHNAAFRALGVDAVYMPMPAASADDFMTFANALGVQGASVTIPYKIDLFRKVDAADELSKTVGAINTLRREGGRWLGRNTDVAGFLAPIAGRLPLRGARTAILGSGGAARGVAVALASQGSTVTVYGRNRAKADEVASIAQGRGSAYPVPPESWDLLVNTTPVGTVPNVDQTPFEGPFDGRLVYDLIYNPQRTRLLSDAEASGCETIGGLDMLVAQAVEQSAWWIGHRPSADLMRQAAQASL